MYIIFCTFYTKTFLNIKCYKSNIIIISIIISFSFYSAHRQDYYSPLQNKVIDFFRQVYRDSFSLI